jgi:hypothetical protein
MMLKNLLKSSLYSTLFIASLTQAAVLTPGQKVFRQDFSISSSDEIYKATSDPVKYSSTSHPDATVKYYQTTSSLTYGLGNNMQIDVKGSYAYSTIEDGVQGDAGFGASRSQLNELSVGHKWELFKLNNSYQYSLGLITRFVHPIETEESKPAFLALNDFSEKFIIGLEESLVLGPVSFIGTAKYIKRFNAAEDQLNMDITMYSRVSQRFSLGVSGFWMHTFSGPDIGTPAWASEVANRKHPPFWLVRERYYGAGGFVQYIVSSSLWVDLSCNSKLWGRNTDKNSTMALGLNLSF